MRKIKLIVYILVANILFSVGCQKSETLKYVDNPTIFFQNDESIYSFIEDADGLAQGFGYVEIPVLLSGNLSDVDREFSAVILMDEEESTISEGMLEVVGGTIKAGDANGSLRIKVNYTKEMNDNQFIGYLRLASNDHFKTIDLNFAPYPVKVSNTITQPENWSSMAYMFGNKYSNTLYRFTLETLNMSYFPYKYYNGQYQTGISAEEAERWYLSYYDAAALKDIVKTALFRVNEGKPADEWMKHEDGDYAGETIQLN